MFNVSFDFQSRVKANLLPFYLSVRPLESGKTSLGNEKIFLQWLLGKSEKKFFVVTTTTTTTTTQLKNKQRGISKSWIEKNSDCLEAAF